MANIDSTQLRRKLRGGQIRQEQSMKKARHCNNFYKEPFLTTTLALSPFFFPFITRIRINHARRYRNGNRNAFQHQVAADFLKAPLECVHVKPKSNAGSQTVRLGGRLFTGEESQFKFSNRWASKLQSIPLFLALSLPPSRHWLRRWRRSITDWMDE